MISRYVARRAAAMKVRVGATVVSSHLLAPTGTLAPRLLDSLGATSADAGSIDRGVRFAFPRLDIQSRGFSSGPPGGFSGQSQPWVHPDAQVPGQNLEQYGVDLTKMAKEGKLDPVIGRRK